MRFDVHIALQYSTATSRKYNAKRPGKQDYRWIQTGEIYLGYQSSYIAII